MLYLIFILYSFHANFYSEEIREKRRVLLGVVLSILKINLSLSQTGSSRAEICKLEDVSHFSQIKKIRTKKNWQFKTWYQVQKTQ